MSQAVKQGPMLRQGVLSAQRSASGQAPRETTGEGGVRIEGLARERYSRAGWQAGVLQTASRCHAPACSLRGATSRVLCIQPPAPAGRRPALAQRGNDCHSSCCCSVAGSGGEVGSGCRCCEVGSGGGGCGSLEAGRGLEASGGLKATGRVVAAQSRREERGKGEPAVCSQIAHIDGDSRLISSS